MVGTGGIGGTDGTGGTGGTGGTPAAEAELWARVARDSSAAASRAASAASRTAAAAVKTYPKDAIYVFGHGSARFGVEGTQDDLLVFRDYLSGLLDYVGRRIAAGDLRESIVAIENLPGFPDFHQPLPNRLGLNLGVAYDELTEKE